MTYLVVASPVYSKHNLAVSHPCSGREERYRVYVASGINDGS